MFQPPAFRAIHIKHDRIVRKPVNESGNNVLILNKLRPLGEWMVSCVEGTGDFISGADYLEQKAGFVEIYR